MNPGFFCGLTFHESRYHQLQLNGSMPCFVEEGTLKPKN